MLALYYRQEKREINVVPCCENVYVLLDDAGDSGELRRVALEAERDDGGGDVVCNGCDPAAIHRPAALQARHHARAQQEG